MSGRIRLVFTVSILLNVLLVGAGVGMYGRWHHDRFVPESLSAESREYLSKAFREGHGKVKPLFEEAKARRAKVEAILNAETFDKAVYDVAVANLLDTREKISRSRAAFMGGVLEKLPAEDRKKFSRRVLDGLEGRRPHGKGPYQRREKGDEKSIPRSEAPR